jgi:hypothetical protein
MFEEPIRAMIAEEVQKYTDKIKPIHIIVPEFLNTDGVEKYFGIPKSTLASWRSQGNGPAFCRNGRLILYSRKDVEAFVKTYRVRTSAQPTLDWSR